MPTEIEPETAVVRPRAVSPETGDVLPLDELVQSWIGRHDRGVIQIVGGPGSGKSTAIRHLAAVLPPLPQVRYFDRCDQVEAESFGHLGSAVATTDAASEWNPDPLPYCRLPLAPWSEDDWIEYLRARHPQQCGSVMQRLLADADRPVLGGNPELWSLVLDRMVDDESAVSVIAVLRKEIPKRFVNRQIRELAAQLCFEVLVRGWKATEDLGAKLLKTGCADEVLRFVRHREIQLSVAALMILAELGTRRGRKSLAVRWPADLIHAVAAILDDAGIQVLENLARMGRDRWSANLVSLLVARNRRWSPSVPIRTLDGATLTGVMWRGIRLVGSDLKAADFSDAQLSEANLDGADCRWTNFRDADLESATFSNADAEGANLSGARLVRLVAMGTGFRRANSEGADFAAANLTGATFSEANLRNARFCDADLSCARLTSADIAGADFSNAVLDYSELPQLPLRECVLDRARFRNAMMSGCDLEFVQLTNPDFSGANLTSAYLTGSQLPGANFRGATLCQAGLADVDWERADLRDADLRNCAFHMGSSRSGLVDSPLASEGTRTGFYTDEYLEQTFKPPETVRKANLRGADLRGANIEGVDFYLVDLRDAVYTEQQRRHFESCRAILEDRSS